MLLFHLQSKERVDRVQWSGQLHRVVQMSEMTPLKQQRHRGITVMSISCEHLVILIFQISQETTCLDLNYAEQLSTLHFRLDCECGPLAI